MNLVLANPRDRVVSASITAYRGQVFLSVALKMGHTKSDHCNSITAAKRLFSTHILSPRQHGPNKWKEA